MKNFYLTLSILLLFFVSGCKESSEDAEEQITIEASSDKIDDKTSVKAPPVAVIAPGEFVEYHPNGGIKMKGIYSETLQREGLWMSFYENGVKWSESYYSNGKLDGHSLTFYPNGKIRYVGEYQDDKKIGAWSFYDEQGKLTKEEKY